jgi:NifU-like protein
MSEKSPILCHCMGVDVDTVRRVICERKLDHVRDVTRHCRAGGGCKSCHVEIMELITADQAARGSFLRRLWMRIRGRA